jgi:predicted deacetylase
MEAHQHHGFEPEDVLRYFTAPRWRLAHRKRFQLGLNNLFVFRLEIGA